MVEICEVTTRFTDLYHWVNERWAYFAVGVLACLLIYYITGSTMQAVFGILILMCMWLSVLWIDRLPRKDQLWWQRLVGITVILLAVTIALGHNPVSALIITDNPAGDQIRWEIADGEPPY